MMKLRSHALSLSALVYLLTSAASAHAALNLEQSFQAALKRSEDLATQEEVVKQAEETYKQAVGGVMPTIAFSGIYLHQPSSSTTSGGTSLSPTDQQTYKFTADQPLFRGFREYAGIKLAKLETDAQVLLRDQAYLQVFQDTTSAFYNVVANERDLINIQNEIEVNQKRLKDIQHFERVGRNRKTDVLSVESNIATLEITKETLQTQLDTSRAVYAFMTGLDKNTQLADNETLPSTVPPMGEYVGKIDNRPDVRSALSMVQAYEKNITVAEGAHLPSLDLLGNYYLERPGYLNGINWDVSLGLSVPIFQGGVIQSQVRVAASELKQKELALSKTRRTAEQSIVTQYSIVMGDMAQVVKQKKGLDVYSKTNDAEMHDYRYGLVTILEVLVALNTSQEAQRTYDRLIYQFKSDYLTLLALVAERPVIMPVDHANSANSAMLK